jgi:hypothetical protein
MTRRWITIYAIACFCLAVFLVVYEFSSRYHADALAECSTLGGTLIVSADDRYICVPDAVEVGDEKF